MESNDDLPQVPVTTIENASQAGEVSHDSNNTAPPMDPQLARLQTLGENAQALAQRLFSSRSQAEEVSNDSSNIPPPMDPQLARLQTLGENAQALSQTHFSPRPPADSEAQSPPPSPPSFHPAHQGEYLCESDESDTDMKPDFACSLCDRRKIRVRFSECSHAACRTCTNKLWKSRWEHFEFPPTWFACPFCRTNIHQVRDINSDGDENTSEVAWRSIHNWIIDQDKNLVPVFEKRKHD